MNLDSPTENLSHPSSTSNRWHRFCQWFWRITLIASLGYAWYCFYVPSNSIAWAKDFSAAQDQAVSSNKPIVMYFTAKWCVPCRIMKRTVWADEDVEAIVNKNSIPLMIDMDDSSAAEIVQRYRVTSTPTTIIVDSKGNVLEHVIGGISKVDFLNLLNPSS
jgi:thioredoxin 1